MDSKKYWRAREEAQRQKDIKDADKYAGKIREIYQRTYFNIQDQINAFYTKYATETGLSMAEVKKKVSSLDIERYNKLAEKYVRNKDLSQMANEAMRIYNLTMKINRLEMLKSEIGMELASNFSDVEGLFSEALNKTATDEIERQAGILGKTVVDTTKKADAIVNSSFNNATFSDRIWMHQEALRQDLNRVISNSIIQGKHPRTFIKDIVDRFDVSKNQADRLLITEVCRVQTEVQKQSYERDGYTEYEFIAEPTACPICRGLDGHIYKVSKMMPGENAPPLHPRCRCSTAPYMDRAEFDKWLDEYGKENHKAEKIKFNNEHDQNYRSVNVDVLQNINVRTTKGSEFTASRINGLEEYYLSNNIKLKPKQLQKIKNITEKAFSLMNIEMNRPKVVITRYTDMSVGALASYDAIENVLKINKSILSAVSIEEQNITLLHELYHFTDAMQYEKKKGKITKETYVQYINELQEKHKTKVESLEKKGYNMAEISQYAKQKMIAKDYTEVYTEYRAYLKGGKTNDIR